MPHMFHREQAGASTDARRGSVSPTLCAEASWSRTRRTRRQATARNNTPGSDPADHAWEVHIRGQRADEVDAIWHALDAQFVDRSPSCLSGRVSSGAERP